MKAEINVMHNKWEQQPTIAFMKDLAEINTKKLMGAAGQDLIGSRMHEL